MKKIINIMPMIWILIASIGWAADVTGDWTLKMQNPYGEEEQLDMVIKAEGENLTITSTHPKFKTLTGSGTLKGNEITMRLEGQALAKVTFDLKGTVSGDKMAGTREISGVSLNGGEGDAHDSGNGRGGNEASSVEDENAASQAPAASSEWMAEKK